MSDVFDCFFNPLCCLTYRRYTIVSLEWLRVIIHKDLSNHSRKIYRDIDQKQSENNMKTSIPLAMASILGLSIFSESYAKDIQEKQQQLQAKQGEVKEKQEELRVAVQKQSAKQAQRSYDVMQQMSRATKIIGTVVKNTSDEDLGDIKDLVLDPESGQVVYAVVSFGGVTGVNNQRFAVPWDKLFAVPWPALHWSRDKEYFVLDVDKSALNNAPGFDKKHWPDSTDKWSIDRDELDRFYHLTR